MLSPLGRRPWCGHRPDASGCFLGVGGLYGDNNSECEMSPKLELAVGCDDGVVRADSVVAGDKVIVTGWAAGVDRYE